eukprot:TRINITY_DN774004_c0_g1_i1.p1 TRINITY_DN774004_c0_g1~~TRINITY_DN774004_c0_g1_i1.p1  ORF type:complete len:481 (+),score=106.99 TRINITY_DN774004_c0_g1_i1:92-1534(+)
MMQIANSITEYPVFGHLDSSVSFLHNLTKAPVDQLEFVIVLLLCSVVGVLAHGIRSPNFKNMFTIIATLYIGSWGYGVKILNEVFMSIFVYLYIKHAPKKFTHPVYIFVFSMLNLSGWQLYRMFTYDGGVLDHTGALMVLTIKWQSFAWNRWDGLKENYNEEKDKERNYVAIKEIPKFIDYMGYTFFFATFFAGPGFEYKQYHSWAHASELKNKRIATRKECVKPALKALFGALGCMAIVQILGIYGVNAEATADKTMLERSIFYRFFFVWLSTCGFRYPYYFAWKFSEFNAALGGLIDTRHADEEGSIVTADTNNANLLLVELSGSPRSMMTNWNLATSRWLRYYIYERLPSNIRTLAAFVCSAWWHGFYPGYYFTFVLASFLTTAGRDMRRLVRPFFAKGGVTPWWYNTIGFILSTIMLNITAVTFKLLDFKRCWWVFVNTTWPGFTLFFAAILVMKVFRRKIMAFHKRREAKESKSN